jgi:hypothetical protein
VQRKCRKRLYGCTLGSLWRNQLTCTLDLVQVGTRQFDIRYWGQGDDAFDIEAALSMEIRNAPAARWQPWPITEDGSCLEVDADGRWTVVCGKPFTVALELVDAFENK